MVIPYPYAAQSTDMFGIVSTPEGSIPAKFSYRPWKNCFIK
jgi:hypothetical protein